MTNALSKRFEEFSEMLTFSRVSSSHPLDLYIGKDQLFRNTLLLISDCKPKKMSSTKIIEVALNQRKDRKWAISFSLEDSRFLDVFCCFCTDIIDSTATVNDITFGNEFICERYLKWQTLLKKQSSGLLSFSEVKGLIGELHFLKTYMTEKYGVDKAINSWIGPDYADQDFVCDDTWYEVKSTVPRSDSVRISSVEQLDSKIPGHLSVVYLDKTSDTDKKRLSLNALVKEVKNSIPDTMLQLQFESKLIELGYYYHEDYDRINFKLGGVSVYSVGQDFPCIRKDSTPISTVRISYDLLLSHIDEFKEASF